MKTRAPSASRPCRLSLAMMLLALPLLCLGAQGLMVSRPDTGGKAIGLPIPISLLADAPADSTSAATAPVQGGEQVPAQGALPSFPGKIGFHRISGWTSGGLLLAAGLVGGIHFLDMMTRAHAYRDTQGIDEYNPAVCPPVLLQAWSDPTEQALRWTHVGLLATGEVFYLANAVTGSSLIGPLPPGMSPSRLHRYAFFAHAALMVAEAGLGLAMSAALARADHEAMAELGVAHAAVGLAIPLVILGAGAIMP